MASSAESVITRGVIRKIFGAGSNSSPADNPNPILQVLQIKPIPGQAGSPERYRVVFSDTVNFIQSMVASQSNHLIQSGQMKKGCLVRLTSYQANLLKERKILIVLKLEVLEEYGINEKIGNPQSLDNAPGTEAAPAAPPATNAASASSFYGNQPAAAQDQARPQQRQAPQRQEQSYSAQRHGGSSASHANIYPIEALSPYQNKWTIKARIIFKSEMKTWQNARGEGKLFNVTFMDETGEIRATAFKDEANKYFDVLQEGKVYYVSKCRVNLAKRQFSNVNNEYELTFTQESEVEECPDSDSVPQVKYSFIPLKDLEEVQNNAIVDVIGVIKEVDECREIVSKNTNKPYSKRDITLVDNTAYSVRLTIWGAQAQSFDLPIDSVVAFKAVKVSDFGGKSLSALNSSTLIANPDIDEAYRLKGWWDSEGRNASVMTHQGLSSYSGGRKNPFKNLMQLKNEDISVDSEAIYFDTKATITFISRENAFYPACMGDKCNKKVVESGDGWFCEACNQTWPRPQYRYIMQCTVQDPYAGTWFSMFDDVGRILLGMSADDLQRIQQENEEEYNQVFERSVFKQYNFACRAKMDTYQEQTKLRVSVLRANPVDFKSDAHKLIEQIKLYN